MNKLKKRRRKNKNNKKYRYAFIALFAILFMASAYSLMNVKLAIEGKSEIIVNKTECKYNITGGYKLGNKWENGNQLVYSTDVSIKNNGKEPIKSWKMIFEGPSDLDIQFVNAKFTKDNGKITLENYFWNGTINPGETFVLNVAFMTVERSLKFSYILFNDCLIYGKNSGYSPPQGQTTTTTTTTQKVDINQEYNIEINPSEYKMTVGETAKLNTVITPTVSNPNLRYVSSDSNVVSVDENGFITANKVGNATITVAFNGKTSSSVITVEENKPTNSSKATFTNTGYWGNLNSGYTLNYCINYTNDTGNELHYLEIILNVPDNTQNICWTHPCKTEHQKIIYSGQINAGESVDIEGQIGLPPKYSLEELEKNAILDIRTGV